jgi:hypothetical protein
MTQEKLYSLICTALNPRRGGRLQRLLDAACRRLGEDEVDGLPAGVHGGGVLQPQERLQAGHAVPERGLLLSAAVCRRRLITSNGDDGGPRALVLPGRCLPALLGRGAPHGGREVELGRDAADLARGDVVRARGVLGGGVGAQPDARALARVADLRRPPAPRAAPDAAVRRLAARRRQPRRRRQVDDVLAALHTQQRKEGNHRPAVSSS